MIIHNRVKPFLVTHSYFNVTCVFTKYYLKKSYYENKYIARKLKKIIRENAEVDRNKNHDFTNGFSPASF